MTVHALTISKIEECADGLWTRDVMVTATNATGESFVFRCCPVDHDPRIGGVIRDR